MWYCLALTFLGLVLLVFYVIEKSKRYSIKSLLIKTLVSFIFVSVALVATYLKSGHIFNVFIILGLLLGLSGDIWLDLKFIYPKDDKIYSYAGFIVFGVGHILYVTGMFIEFLGSASFLYALIPLVASLILGTGNAFIGRFMKLDYKDMKLIVAIYGVLLFSTPLSALSLCILTGFNVTTLVMMFVGGILFAISDLVLSKTYFSEGHEKPLDFILNYFTYYPAQFLIALSLVFLF